MIFEFSEYRPYLHEKLGKKGTRTGLRKKLSEKLQVHTTFISQVMLGKADLSLEQAEGCNSFFSHTNEESEYFLLLVMFERAGVITLKNRFEEKIKQMQSKHLNISERLKPQTEVSQEDKQKFYSSYIYSAIHVLVSIPQFQTIAALARALNLPTTEIKQKIEFMKTIGLVVQQGDRILHGPHHVHLGSDSNLIIQHHRNWRLQAMNSLDHRRENDIHYSAAVSLSKKDAMKIKDSILENLHSNVKVISSSPEEVAYGYSFDFFSLTQIKE